MTESSCRHPKLGSSYNHSVRRTELYNSSPNVSGPTLLVTDPQPVSHSLFLSSVYEEVPQVKLNCHPSL